MLRLLLLSVSDGFVAHLTLLSVLHNNGNQRENLVIFVKRETRAKGGIFGLKLTLSVISLVGEFWV